MTSTLDRPGTGTAWQGGDPFAEPVAIMQAALAAVADVPAWSLDEDTVQERLGDVLRIRASVEELTAWLAASVVERDVPRVAGAHSPRSWLMSTHGMSTADASRLLAEASVLEGERPDRRCGLTRQAWAAGAVPAERAVLTAQAVASVGDAVDASATDRLQTDLLAQSPRLSYAQFQILCRHAAAVVDPEGADAALEAQLQADEARARQLTQFRCRRVGDGTTRGSFRIPDLAADMLRAALDATTSPRHQHSTGDRPEAAATTGPATAEPAKPTPYPQRLGQAFVELIEHLPTDELPQHGVANASITVTITLDQLRAGLGDATLDTGTVISTGETRRLACNATLVPAVLAGPSRILDLGMSRRLFDRHQRLALAIRDRGCSWPGCDRPPAWCEAHHITAWSDGGPTDLANGCLLCSWHHHVVHRGEWSVRMATDGVAEVIPPTRIDAHQRPRRHERFTQRARC